MRNISANNIEIVETLHMYGNEESILHCAQYGVVMETAQGS